MYALVAFLDDAKISSISSNVVAENKFCLEREFYMSRLSVAHLVDSLAKGRSAV